MVLVMGATGRTGGAAAAAFFRKLEPVRVLIRSESRRQAMEDEGYEVVVGDLTRDADVRRAMDGVDAVYHVAPQPLDHPDPVALELDIGRRVVDAAKDYNVKHFIYLSVFGADRKTGIPHFKSKAQIERWIEEAGLSYTFLRPCYFMENLDLQKKEILGGTLTAPMNPEVPLSIVSIEDIGRAAAAAHAWKKVNRAFDLVGPRGVTFTEVAAAFGKALGENVAYRPIPPSEWAKGAKAFMSPRLADDLALMFERYNEGTFVGKPNAMREELGIEPTSIESYALQKVNIWKGVLTAQEGILFNPRAEEAKKRPETE